MDTEKKDNLTDVVESLENVETPEDSIKDDSEHVVLDSDGEAVTLDQKESDNK